jgi:hypothetical protein
MYNGSTILPIVKAIVVHNASFHKSGIKPNSDGGTIFCQCHETFFKLKRVAITVETIGKFLRPLKIYFTIQKH